MQTNERNESNANEYNDNDNAFYLAVSIRGTALIEKRARKPEVVCEIPVAARTFSNHVKMYHSALLSGVC